ncbi:hypothetical protein SPI_02329 [Niveomyces insectorum RCEF 264]|uniref:Uncharacterized protein n=1 Tax=Niveomyces insectorum RCEF 264 TaxID=1081102 RepID=A0A162J960_9HYPO|nr:hypothetical protein SPI_02329 [Niveomyces insectorum RCEF 264]
MATTKYSYSIRGGPTPTYPPRELIEQQQQQQQHYQQYQQDYDQQQLHQQQHQQHYGQRDAAPLSSVQRLALPSRNPKRASTRPSSSVYSQPSPIITDFQTTVHPPQSYQQHEQGQQWYQPPQQQPYQQQPYGQHENYQQHPHQDSYQVARYPNGQQIQDARNADGVSPPSSPEFSPADLGSYDGQRTPPNISPVDAVPPPLFATMSNPSDGRPGSSRSNIPTMRRERRLNQDAAARTLRESKSKERLQLMQERTSSIASSTRGYKGGEVRWDPRTGELTSSEKGRPGQVKPAEYARGLASTSSGPADPAVVEPKAPAAAATGIAGFASRLRRTVQNAAAGGAAPSTAQAAPPGSPVAPTAAAGTATATSALPVPVSAQERTQEKSLPTVTDPAAGAFSSNRPAWHGASGRTTLVPPVRDVLDAPPLNIPRKSSKRVASIPKLTDGAANPSIIPSSSPSSHQNAHHSIVSPPVSPPPLRDETPDRAAVREIAPSGQQSAWTTPPPPTNKAPTSPTSSATQNYPSPPQSGDPTYKESLSSQQEQQQHQQIRAAKIRRKPAPSHQNLASFDQNDPFNYNNRGNPTFVPSPISPQPSVNEPEWTQPASRFSVTTYNSTPQDSSDGFDPSDAPEMPPIPDPLRSSPPYATRRQVPQYPDSSPAQSPRTPKQQQQQQQQQQQEQWQSPTRQRPSPIVTKALPKYTHEGGVMDRRRPPRMGATSPYAIRDDNNEPIVISLKTPWMSGSSRPTSRSADDDRHGGYGSAGTSTGTTNGGDQSSDPLRNKNLMGAVGAALRGGGAADTSAAARASMAGSVHKTLPPAPPEMSAKDRVTMLNAQLAGLAQRRINIGRSIKQMTELMPTDNLLAPPDVLHRREVEKRKVENLRTDLAEIQREEYEIGLKLHRAYKRLDKNAEYEPTTLWVRRVTG